MNLLPGVGAALIAVFVATVLGALVPAVPVLTLAVVLGIVVGQLPGFRRLLDGVLKPGISFAARFFMRSGIVLLGLALSVPDIADLGWLAILAIVVVVVVSFLGTLWLGRMLRLPGHEPLLVAAGFSICGASAIGAMAGATRSTARDQATPVALVTLCGTLAIAILPALMAPLGLSDEQFGRWVGGGVHDVGQVVATAQTAGAAALAVAVVVKLTRVLMLAPMVATASVLQRRSDARATSRSRATAYPAVAAVPEPSGASGPAAPAKRPPIVPLFIVGFALAVLANSFLDLPPALLDTAHTVQTLLLAAALFALGTGIRVLSLLRTGWRALIVGLVSWVLIAVLAYVVVFIG